MELLQTCQKGPSSSSRLYVPTLCYLSYLGNCMSCSSPTCTPPDDQQDGLHPACCTFLRRLEGSCQHLGWAWIIKLLPLCRKEFEGYWNRVFCSKVLSFRGQWPLWGSPWELPHSSVDGSLNKNQAACLALVLQKPKHVIFHPGEESQQSHHA